MITRILKVLLVLVLTITSSYYMGILFRETQNNKTTTIQESYIFIDTIIGFFITTIIVFMILYIYMIIHILIIRPIYYYIIGKEDSNKDCDDLDY